MSFMSRRAAVWATGLLMGWSTLATAADKLPDTLKTLTLAGEKVPTQQVDATPMNGLYRVKLPSGETFYTDAAGKYLFVGNMFENTPQGLVNLTEQSLVRERVSALKKLKDTDAIVYKPAGKVKAVVTVFSDSTCGYCRKLHEELPVLNKAGVEVRYMTFPRQGPDSNSARQLAQVLCSTQPTEAFSAVMRGETLKNDGSKCMSRVAQQFELGRTLGIHGTPAIVTEEGRLLSGYAPADQLLQQIGIKQ